ncbi:hypothetical protein D9M73_237770 [compost metagenome]
MTYGCRSLARRHWYSPLRLPIHFEAPTTRSPVRSQTAVGLTVLTSPGHGASLNDR